MREPEPQWTLVRTQTFLRELRKYLKKHPDRVGLVRDTLIALSNDPQSPSLRLHQLKGRMAGVSTVRLTYHDRILLVVRVIGRQIVLLDIGTHDEVYS